MEWVGSVRLGTDGAGTDGEMTMAYLYVSPLACFSRTKVVKSALAQILVP